MRAAAGDGGGEEGEWEGAKGEKKKATGSW